MYKLFSEESEKKDIKKAYYYLEKALIRGVTYFEEMQQFFSKNYEELSQVFIEDKKPPSLVNTEDKKEVSNMHEAYINELRTTFSAALTNDRLYHRPAGFIQDNQIWLLGVQTKHFIKEVLHYEHSDFIKAIKQDLGPMISDIGLWALNNYATL